MLENKRINMILSLMIAIALWAFVIGEVNPEATRVYREIPIHLVQETELDENGLAVLSISDTTLTVTLTGNRSEVNQIREKDIAATVDLSQAAIGENHLRVEVRVPSKVDVELQSINKVTVIVEEKISKDVPVQVRYNGTFAEEEEPITISQSMDTVTVTGAETNIGRVDHVNAAAAEGAVTEEESAFDCILTPVDRNNNKVYNVELSAASIEVTAELAKTKTVPLHVPIVEDESDRLQRTVTVPQTITVKGRTADLEGIESVEAEPLDISNITKTAEVEIVPILPEGVEISVETELLAAQIQVAKSISRAFTFTEDDVNFVHLRDNRTAEMLTEKIQITAVGMQDVISTMTKDDFVLTADLDGKGKGTCTITLKATCSVEGIRFEANPQQIKVKIHEAAVDETPGDHNGDQDEQDGEDTGEDDSGSQNGEDEEENQNQDDNQNDDNMEE